MTRTTIFIAIFLSLVSSASHANCSNFYIEIKGIEGMASDTNGATQSTRQYEAYTVISLKK